ncbi:MAG: hypothetical protein PHQ96_05575 [Candidatus Omnitrophica bacterium]|nr:hypothetical protein [Candidatus Omnitrophota bacterium]
MRYISRTVFLVLFIILLGGCGGALGTLIELGGNEKLKRKSAQEETHNFLALKAALINNKIHEGITTEEVMRRFGEPVLSYQEAAAGRWVYKAAAADWFSGEKIYLFFDKNGNLTGWKCINCK